MGILVAASLRAWLIPEIAARRQAGSQRSYA